MLLWGFYAFDHVFPRFGGSIPTLAAQAHPHVHQNQNSRDGVRGRDGMRCPGEGGSNIGDSNKRLHVRNASVPLSIVGGLDVHQSSAVHVGSK